VQLQASTGTSLQECHVAVIPVTRREQFEDLHSAILDLQAFTYSVAHELRTPLRSISSLAGVLLEDFGGGLNEEAKSSIHGIIKKTRGMSGLIDSLLVFSRNSKQELNSRPVDMNTLAHELVRMLSEELDADIEFRVGELPHARGDWRMLGQALENLLSNAAKFSRTVVKPVIEVGSIADEKENIYYVKDNGIGFDMKYAGTIFDVFTRLHKTEDFEGTGVGLAIVEQIIKKHEGKVWAESRQGQGATFFFSLQK
jgi:light-regulated signal transduction histidine kinase (bacteriophytochrome)